MLASLPARQGGEPFPSHPSLWLALTALLVVIMVARPRTAPQPVPAVAAPIRDAAAAVEAPGLTAEQIDVSVTGQTLTIRGSKPDPRDQSDKRARLKNECRYGNFRRAVDLPAPVNADAIAATCRNGVLDVRIPKAVAARPQAVKVTSLES